MNLNVNPFLCGVIEMIDQKISNCHERHEKAPFGVKDAESQTVMEKRGDMSQINHSGGEIMEEYLYLFIKNPQEVAGYPGLPLFYPPPHKRGLAWLSENK